MGARKTGAWEGREGDLHEAIRAVAAAGGSIRGAAMALGIDRGTLRNRYRRAVDMFGAGDVPAGPPEALAELVADLPAYSKVRARLRSFNGDAIDAEAAKRLVRLRCESNLALLFFIGDPHLDSPGFDEAAFYADLETIRRAQDAFPGAVWSINMGDVLDHWPTGGKLGAKNQDSHLTRKEALSLVRGFLREEGINFAAHLLGNHDQFLGGDFAVLMSQWATAPVVDWAAYIHLSRGDAPEFTVFAAHDMAGHSMYNPTHGLQRRAREDGTADLYVAAHRHSTGRAADYNGHRQIAYQHMRVSGYKVMDEYAWRKGYPEAGPEGATGLAVINLDARTFDSRARLFYDLDEGVEWARFLAR